jgi:hypothetical protein
MLIAAAVVLVISVVITAILGSLFRLSLKREAPHLYQALWTKSLGSHSVRTSMVVPLAAMIYLRNYRRELAEYPKSRAWASWLFANGWLQLGAFAAMVVAVLGK